MEPERQPAPRANLSAAIPLDRVSVTFRGHAPDEGIVYFVRRCADRLKRGGQYPLEVHVQRHSGVHEIRLRAFDGSGGDGSECDVVEIDPDAYLAVRNAFGRFEQAELHR